MKVREREMREMRMEERRISVVQPPFEGNEFDDDKQVERVRVKVKLFTWKIRIDFKKLTSSDALFV